MISVLKRATAVILTVAAFMIFVLVTQGAEESHAAAFKPKVTVDANKVTVTWAKQKGYSKYEVWYRYFYKPGGYRKMKATKKLSKTFKGKYCTGYKIYVKAKKGGKSKRSSEVKFETGSNPNWNVKRIASLPSYQINANYYASRTDAIVFVGDDLYFLKSAHNAVKKEVHRGYYPMVLGCIRNFSKYADTQNPPVKYRVIRYANGELYYGSHGSSIAYYNGDFYIVAVESHKKSGKPIIRVGGNGRIKQEIDTKGFYYDGAKFSALAFYGMTEEGGKSYPQFICRDGKNTTRVSSAYGYELHRFSIGTLKDGVLRRDSSFMTENTREAAFWQRDKSGRRQLHSNDIGYDAETGSLYHPIFIYEKNGKNIKKNWLYSYNVTDSTELWEFDNDYKTNTLKQIGVEPINLKKKKSSETKFEIEGVDTYQGNVYLGVNNDGVEDAVYMVK